MEFLASLNAFRGSLWIKKAKHFNFETYLIW